MAIIFEIENSLLEGTLSDSKKKKLRKFASLTLSPKPHNLHTGQEWIFFAGVAYKLGPKLQACTFLSTNCACWGVPYSVVAAIASAGACDEPQ